jgi:glycosyltransferase involved in cell wall biosynthesis
MAYLEAFGPVLRELQQRRDVEIRIQSNARPALPGIPFVWRPWTASTEVSEISEFDIGIKPMPDTPWTRGKCPMKELQYMALGIPPVCSAVGATRQLVRHGENGFLASTDREWLDCLVHLIDEPDLRQRMGMAGRRTVVDRYSTRVAAGLFADVVRSVVEDER